jgi:predicted HicB family RNase H-like nuclease
MGELRLSIPNGLHKELKQRALDKGVSLKQLILDIFENYTNKGRTEKGKTKKEG